jgi:hypothetical protein
MVARPLALAPGARLGAVQGPDWLARAYANKCRVPIIAIPLVIVAHWRRAVERYGDGGTVPRFGSAEYFRMSDGERAATFVATLALFVDVVIVLGRRDTPRALAVAIFAGYLGLDFCVGLRYPERRRKSWAASALRLGMPTPCSDLTSLSVLNRDPSSIIGYRSELQPGQPANCGVLTSTPGG